MITFKIAGKELAEELGKAAGFAAQQANFLKKEVEAGNDPTRSLSLSIYEWQVKARRFDWMAKHINKDEDQWITEAEAKSLELF